MKRKVVWTLLFIATLMLGLASLTPSIIGGEPRNPSLFEKRFQANQLAAFFDVDPDIARQWVPPAFELVITGEAPNEKATGVFVVIHGPDYSAYSTPNNPPMKESENIAPDYIAHFWIVIKKPAWIPATPFPIEGAEMMAPTGYYYDVADLVTNTVAHRLYRRAGRPAILVGDITLVDEGLIEESTGVTLQTGEVTFLNGSKITFEATTPLRAAPLMLGSNFWQWHVGGLGEMGDDLGVRLDPATGNPSNVSTTRGQYLGLTPGNPNSTQTTIYADADTPFEDVFGTNYVESVKGTFFKPNNIVLNASRGDLLWTTYPSPIIPPPPDFPEP
jgi:hypothetical protein